MAALSLRAAPTHCPSPSAPVTTLEPTSPAAGARHRCWPSVSAPPPPPCFSPASSPCWVRASSGARAEPLGFHPIFYTIVFYFFALALTCGGASTLGGVSLFWGPLSVPCHFYCLLPDSCLWWSLVGCWVVVGCFGGGRRVFIDCCTSVECCFQFTFFCQAPWVTFSMYES